MITIGSRQAIHHSRKLIVPFAEHSGQLFLLAVEPRLDVVREDPRFRALAEKNGLPASV
jgi:hypothetical protein